MRRRRSRGATFTEVLISLALSLIGMLAMFRVLASSVAGATNVARLGQAQARAKQLVEAMRFQSPDALKCLSESAVAEWRRCPTVGLDLELAGYSLLANGRHNGGDSFVALAGESGRVYDIQITVGFREGARLHAVTLRTGVFR